MGTTRAGDAQRAQRTPLWLDGAATRFPKAARAQLGRRILDAALDAMSSTADAALRPRGEARIAELQLANRRLTLLRLLLRGACERRYLAKSQHEHASRLIHDWGRQLGGWLRAERGQRRRAARAAHEHPSHEPPTEAPSVDTT